MLILTESLHHVFVWLSENRRSGASDLQTKKIIIMKKKRVLLDPVLTVG